MKLNTVEENLARELKVAYKRYDQQGEGLDKDGLGKALSDMGCGLESKALEEMFIAVDVDHSGMVDFDEFKQIFDTSRLRKLFKEIDDDNSGFIDESELVTALKMLGYKVTHEQALSMMDGLDSDGDGVISLEEFEEYFAHCPLASLEAIGQKWMAVSGVQIGSELSAPLPSKQDASSWRHIVPFLIAGGVGGAISKIAVAPLERIKIDAQLGFTGKSSVLGAIRAVYAREGIVGLFRGTIPTVAKVFPFSGAVCLTYGTLLKYAPEEDGEMDPMYHVVAGGFAGAVATTLTYPLDLLKARLIAENRHTTGKVGGAVRRSMATIGAELVRREGVRGLFRGLGPTICAVAPFVALQNSIYDALKKIATNPAADFKLFGSGSGNGGGGSSSVSHAQGPAAAMQQQQQPGGSTTTTTTTTSASAAATGANNSATNSAVSVDRHSKALYLYGLGLKPQPGVLMACGALSGILAETVVYPLDVLRRKIQVGIEHGPAGGAGGPAAGGGGALGRMASLFRTGGLYKGIGLTYLKVTPAVAVAVTVRDLVKEQLL